MGLLAAPAQDVMNGYDGAEIRANIKKRVLAELTSFRLNEQLGKQLQHPVDTSLDLAELDVEASNNRVELTLLDGVPLGLGVQAVSLQILTDNTPAKPPDGSYILVMAPQLITENRELTYYTRLLPAGKSITLTPMNITRLITARSIWLTCTCH